MKLNFCTLFDSNYLTRGLALYHSLKSNCEDFMLYIFAFDDQSYDFLKNLKLENTEIIHHTALHTPELLEAIADRTRAEYCWTCTPLVIQHCLYKFNLSSCTYLDADTYFFQTPEIILNEILPTEKSVLITEHYYSRNFEEWVQTSGKYNVQFMTFKNDSNGRTCLDWWAERCIEWCYARTENGKMGDQLYLQDWPQRFKGIHVMENRGGGLAPWNILNFKFKLFKDRCISIEDLNSKKTYTAVFYHFHALKFFKSSIQLTGSTYIINNFVKKYIYERYISELENIKEKYKLGEGQFDHWNSTDDYQIYRFNNQILRACFKIINSFLHLLNLPFSSQLNRNVIIYPENKFRCHS